MDLEYARSLSDQTSDFYARVSASFDATRQSAWPGWERLWELVAPLLPTPPRVLDLACGNLRFARFLSSRTGGLRVWAIDNCDSLAHQGIDALRQDCPQVRVAYRRLDLADALYGTEDLGPLIGAPPCDLAVAFGFMHHVVLPEQRMCLLRAMVDTVVPGGLAVASFWQFAHDERLRAKARPVVGGSEGDYLLGWQGRTDVARFCHSFEDKEIDVLVTGVRDVACELARFSADGRSGALNRYLVLRKPPTRTA